MQVKTTETLGGVGGVSLRKGTRLTVDDAADAGGYYRVASGKYRGLLIDGRHLINTETHQYVGSDCGRRHSTKGQPCGTN